MDQINILDYWGVLVKRRRLIGILVVSAMLASFAVSLFLPDIYASTATIMPPLDDRGASTLLAKGGFGAAASLIEPPSSSKIWLEILGSRNVEDAVIRRFGLMRRYGRDTLEETRLVLKKRVVIRDSKTGVINITAEDADPRMAADLANGLVEELDRVNKGLVMSAGGRTRVFVEKRLGEARINLADAEERLKRFQETHGAVKLDQQSQSVIEAIGRARGQLMAKEVELGTLRTYAAPSNPRVGILQSEIDRMNQEISGLEGGKGAAGNGNDAVLIPATRLPAVTEQYARLMRAMKIQETLYELLVTQYEQARIAEAKDSQTVQVLDRAAVPTKKSKPKRAVIVLLSMFIASVTSVSLAFFIEYVEALKKQTRKGEITWISHAAATGPGCQ